MAIDPALTNTVRVDELPIAPITPESIIPHSIDGVLYQGTISEIIALIPSVTYKAGQVLWLDVTDLYVTNNFDMTAGPTMGLGKPDGLWPGWAVTNGNNGTINMDDCVPLGFGAVRNNMREEVGENSKNYNVTVSGFAVGEDTDAGVAGRLIVSSGLPESGEFLESIKKTTITGPSVTLSIMQKSKVQLFIQKLP